MPSDVVFGGGSDFDVPRVGLGSVWGHLGIIRGASRGIGEHQGGILRSPGGFLGTVFISF